MSKVKQVKAREILDSSGNGNRHRTPFPGGLRKIKIIKYNQT